MLLKKTDRKISAVGAGHSFSALVPATTLYYRWCVFGGISNIDLET
ncbi:MAG: hypothetical protein ACI910_000927 [Oleispira sp.]|jgi:hypothetical protein